METWLLSEFQDDTDLEAEALADGELPISDELDAGLAEMQHEQLDHLMELDEIEYERTAMARLGSQAQTSTTESNQGADDEGPEDLDALVKEYADEIRQHQLEMVEQSQAKK